MIEKRRFYWCWCDKCEKMFDNLLHYEDEKELEYALYDEGWQNKGKKWFCPDCQKGKK